MVLYVAFVDSEMMTYLRTTSLSSSFSLASVASGYLLLIFGYAFFLFHPVPSLIRLDVLVGMNACWSELFA